MATTSITISHPCFPSPLLVNPKKHRTSSVSCKPFLSISSPLGLVPSPYPSGTKLSYPSPPPPSSLPISTRKKWKVFAFRDNFLLLEAGTVENSQELVSTGDDGVSSIISGLLLVAFAGLSILTIGVIYIAVTDFLQKREKEKFEKEEAAEKKKKGGKKGKIRSRARAGPRGFGQKIEDDDDVDSD